jgi:hypothetical protein
MCPRNSRASGTFRFEYSKVSYSRRGSKFPITLQFFQLILSRNSPQRLVKNGVSWLLMQSSLLDKALTLS